MPGTCRRGRRVPRRAGLLAPAICSALLLAGCAGLRFGETTWVTPGPRALSALPGWKISDPGPMLAALQRQCATPTRAGGLPGTICETLPAVAAGAAQRCAVTAPVREATSGPGAPPSQEPARAFCADGRAHLRAWLASRLSAWPVVTDLGDGVGLLTGYHEPLVTGSRLRQNEGQAALYAPPEGPVQGPPPTRERIESDPQAAGLAGRELVWLDDPVEAFFLHIQGSGRVRLRDGTVMRVGYAGNNGHPYHAIGRTLVSEGHMTREQVSAQSIKDWLRTHPAQADAVMFTNPRYIYFRALPARDGGPPGALGVPLTARGSVAVDLGRIPGGALLFGAAVPPSLTPAPAPGLVLAQDTGSAIRGPVRADWFMGSDEEAERLASGLREPLRLWLLWPRGHRPPGRLPLAWALPPA